MADGRDWKGYAAMIVAVTGVLTAWFHKQPEDAAKASYIELTKAILESQEAERKNHEDLVALSASFESYINSHTVIETTVATPVDAGAPPETWVAAPVKPPVPKVVHVVAPPSSAAPVPSIAPLKPPAAPKSVDSIRW